MKIIVSLIASLGFLASSASADAHRSGCHSHHTCPSDHASYHWGTKHLLCVSPTADERTVAFKMKVRYAGRTYYCKR